MAADETAAGDRSNERAGRPVDDVPDELTDEPVVDLAGERRLKALMSAVGSQSSETVERQIAVALSEFRLAGRARRSVPRLARASMAAAVVGLFAAGGWWVRDASTDSPAVAAGNIRPLRGLTSPCDGVTGVYLGAARLAGIDVAVYVEVRGADVSVRLVDPTACTEITMLPAPSPGR